MSDTISTEDNSSEETMICPWTGEVISVQELRDSERQQERVRQRLVASHSSSPLYQARAEKDPEYWNTFYLGQVK